MLHTNSDGIVSTNGIKFMLAAWGGGREVIHSFNYIEFEKFCEGACGFDSINCSVLHDEHAVVSSGMSELRAHRNSPY